MIYHIFFTVLFLISCLSGNAQSQFFADSIFSKSLNEVRRLTVYLPDGYDPSGAAKYPIIYTTDGQLITDSYRREMDSLIGNKLVKPFVLIGSHSNETFVKEAGAEFRNFDYVKGKQGGTEFLNTRFKNHMTFFTNELLGYIEATYAVSSNPQDRTFYGVSNGADFGVSLALAHSDQFKNFILLSIFQGTKEPLRWKKKEHVYFYLGYGLKEPEHVEKEVLRMESYFIKHKIPQTLVTWMGGHERKEWELIFTKALVRLNKQLN